MWVYVYVCKYVYMLDTIVTMYDYLYKHDDKFRDRVNAERDEGRRIRMEMIKRKQRKHYLEQHNDPPKKVTKGW